MKDPQDKRVVAYTDHQVIHLQGDALVGSFEAADFKVLTFETAYADQAEQDSAWMSRFGD